MRAQVGRWVGVVVLAFVAAAMLTSCGSGGGSGLGGGGNASQSGLRFDLDDVIGVAFREDTSVLTQQAGLGSGSTPRSNVVGVSATGAVNDLLASGSATIENFYINSGRLYVVFSEPIALVPEDASTRCVFAVVNSDGVPECIDPSAEYIQWWGAHDGVGAPVQFDGAGAIYYVAVVDDDPVFRRYRDGVTLNLLPPGVVRPASWVVSDEGVVFVTGQTSGVAWLRVIDTDAPQVIRTLLQGDYATSLQRFPDGNVYLWTMGELGHGFARIVRSEEWYEIEPWLGLAGAPHDSVGFGSSNPPHAYYFTPPFGGVSRVFVLQDPGMGKVLGEIYPHPRLVETSVTTITHAAAAVSDVVLAGFDSTATYKLVLYNLLLEDEIDLLDGRQVEVYSLHFVPSEGFVAFDGLDFSTGEYVFGRVDLASGRVDTIELTTRFTGFQAF